MHVDSWIYVLLDNLQLLHQHSGQVLDDVRTIASGLQLDNDGLDNLVVDAGQVDLVIRASDRGVVGVVSIAHLDRRGSEGPGRGRRCVRVRLPALRSGCGMITIVNGA